MKNSNKKGFTIVELVIVIAVIAILAAVLIPTFSSLVKKANLSADKQAVREMNMALAEWSASNGYAIPQDVETAMQILANAGYNSKNWTCLTEGYQVWWDSQENKMVLYNPSTNELEYPEEYSGKEFTALNADKRFKAYNGNYEAAFGFDFKFTSTSADGKLTGKLLSSADKNIGTNTLSNALSGNNSESIKSSIGIGSSDNVYVNASRTTFSSTYNSANPSSTSYARLDALYVSNKQDIILENTGDIKANTYIISVNYSASASDEEKLTAQKAAGEYIYSIFVQSNAGSIDNNITVILPADTTINLSSHEWHAAKNLSGYIGTTDSAHPATIDGLRLTSATGYALTQQLEGSGSRYNLTGFISTVSGKATIENLVFENVTIDSPAKDYTIAEGKSNRNTVAIIGGVIPDLKDRKAAVDVTIRNIVVKDSVNINGIATVGGIVGYIGAEQGYSDLHGNVLIENCKFEGKMQSADSIYVAKGYSPVGGILGFTCRCTDDANITIKNCEFNGTAKGYGKIGGIVGNQQVGSLKIENCVSTGKLEGLGTCTNLEVYDKNDTTYGSYKIGDYKYKGQNYVSTGILIGSKSGKVPFSFDAKTLSNSNAGDKTILIGSKSTTDIGIKYPGIDNYVGIGDTYLSASNTANKYVYFDIDTTAVDKDAEKSFVSYVSQNSKTNAYSRGNSFSLYQYSEADDYLAIADKLIDLKGVRTKTIADAATDAQGNKYDVRINVTRSAKVADSGDNKGKYTYTYQFVFTEVQFVSYDSEANATKDGYDINKCDYKADFKTFKNGKIEKTTTRWYFDNMAKNAPDKTTIKFTVKTTY